MTTDRPAQSRLLSQVSTHDLHWLWPHYIPLGHLTLLEGPPGIGTSLLALHLAACVTAGLPLPDGTTCPKAGVVLLAPHDTRSDILTPRFLAAGGDPSQLILLGAIPDPATRDPEAEPSQGRPFDLAEDLPLLESFIHFLDASLVILDPITTALATTSLAQRLTILAQLADLAQRTHCAILLIRPIGTPSKTLLSSPAHLTTSAARDPIQTAVRSRLLLLPDPVDQETRVLHCPKHCLGPQPASQACLITATEDHLPILLWLGEPYDPIAEQDAASHSRQRQYLLDTLRQSDTALDALTLSRICIQSYHALRKMLQRLLHQGLLVSPARGLFTTPGHLCLLHFPQTATVPNAPTVAPSENDTSPVVAALSGACGARLNTLAPGEENGPTPLNSATTSHSNIPTIHYQPSHPHSPPSESHVPNVATLPSNPAAETTGQLPMPFIVPNENEIPTVVAAQSTVPTGNEHNSAKDKHCITAIKNEPLTVVAARSIAPVGPDESTPPNQPGGTASNVPGQPPNPISPSHESYVSNVATTQHAQPSAEDLYPSVMIRPRKEPEIYPGW
jgi:hypothetical protein